MINVPDVYDQSFTPAHAFCTVEDGVIWFDHGILCERPHLHKGEVLS